MVKQRPSLTLLTVDEPVRVRPVHATELRNAANYGESKLGDGEDGDVDEDDADELEGSCDIGETMLCKGSIHINRAGVSFVPKARAELHNGGKHDDDDIEEDEELVRPPTRKVPSARLRYWCDERRSSHVFTYS